MPQFSLSQRFRICLAAAVAFGVLAATPGPRAQAAKPALYTDEQAQAGAGVFANACAACHGAQLQGVSGPALKGPSFADRAAAESMTAQSLLDVTATSMPQTDPGSLKPEDYQALVAYILQQNGYPAGKTALTAGAAGLKDARITP